MSIRLIIYISPNMELCIARGLLCYRHSICQSVCDLMSNATLVPLLAVICVVHCLRMYTANHLYMLYNICTLYLPIFPL